MTEEGIGFFGVIVASWLGASIALGSCGSCDLQKDLENKVNKKIEQTETRLSGDIKGLEYNLSVRINEVGLGNASSEVYNISGQDYRCVPIKK